MNITLEILTRAQANMQKQGWWGITKDGHEINYSRKNKSKCECVGLHISLAAQQLLALRAEEEAAHLTFLSVVKEPTPRFSGKMSPFGRVTKWNDVPGRHVASAKRALARAVAKAAA